MNYDRDARLAAIEEAIHSLIAKHGAEDAQMILFDVGTKEAIAAFTRVMAAEHARRFHAAGLSPREASYRIADLTSMSVRNARRYADALLVDFQ
ncbi:hypothetical protein [Comamonas sp. BIGb0124]|uniref:hypothetical protein n=1 Tax=Comamonas sp. BIGb0124 TaxID=2485130 RepID=UPI0011CD8A90|nr:hypothetical protein [Comamonas sp. BIGb0124]